MKKWGTKAWFAFMTIFAFISVISFFQIDSYWADKDNLNGVFWGVGIAAALAAAFGLKKVSDKGGTPTS